MTLHNVNTTSRREPKKINHRGEAGVQLAEGIDIFPGYYISIHSEAKKYYKVIRIESKEVVYASEVIEPGITAWYPEKLSEEEKEIYVRQIDAVSDSILEMNRFKTGNNW